jgi:ammonia channel protein AmtB
VIPLSIFIEIPYIECTVLGKFFFQLVFCGTAATIVSGAVAERVKYISFIIFSFVLTLVIYPIVGHWIWAAAGWLLLVSGLCGRYRRPLCRRMAALAGLFILGPRYGKYDKNGKPQAIPVIICLWQLSAFSYCGLDGSVLIPALP